MNVKAIPMYNRGAAEEVWALQHAAYRAEAAFIGVLQLPPLLDTVDDLIASKERFYGMRTPDGELAGAISCEAGREGRQTVCRLMVHPDYHRQGIGTKLLAYLLENEEATEWTVTAEARNAPALALYEKAGFARKGTHRPAPDITLVLLERSVR